MRNVVNQQPFTHYPRLLEMLQEVEQTFTEINALQGERWVGWVRLRLMRRARASVVAGGARDAMGRSGHLPMP